MTAINTDDLGVWPTPNSEEEILLHNARVAISIAQNNLKGLDEDEILSEVKDSLWELDKQLLNYFGLWRQNHDVP